jgi:hypothetical protein
MNLSLLFLKIDLYSFKLFIYIMLLFETINNNNWLISYSDDIELLSIIIVLTKLKASIINYIVLDTY